MAAVLGRACRRSRPFISTRTFVQRAHQTITLSSSGCSGQESLRAMSQRRFASRWFTNRHFLILTCPDSMGNSRPELGGYPISGIITPLWVSHAVTSSSASNWCVRYGSRVRPGSRRQQRFGNAIASTLGWRCVMLIAGASGERLTNGTNVGLTS
jgi:hypothetical protein